MTGVSVFVSCDSISIILLGVALLAFPTGDSRNDYYYALDGTDRISISELRQIDPAVLLRFLLRFPSFFFVSFSLLVVALMESTEVLPEVR